ncbi:MAG: peptidoglycan DD-metalloendopeptidase family protein [Bacteroidetes bacterium]|nr:peptidoglycan DD-metalloendopeptidase family protein [Bacteroidota bacterium]
MSANNGHHISKKKRYTLILMPEDDSGASKTFRFRRWHISVGFFLMVALFFGIFWLLIVYTPIGQFFPITSPGLRNQYTQQLVELHQQLAEMMEELMVLRTYNAKLRNALGEKNIAADSSQLANSVIEMHQSRGPENVEYSALNRRELTAQTDEAKPFTTKGEIKYVEQAYQFPAIFPAQGYITRGFDPSINHYGIDIAGKSGALVYAAADGAVVFSGWTYNDGYVVILSHVDGYMTFYKHNEAILKMTGTRVHRGEAIALLGGLGETSQGPHLHFEIWKDGTPIDPINLVINYSL